MVQIAIQDFSRNLGKRGIASGSHVGRSDDQRIESPFVQFQGSGTYVYRRYARSLHGDGNA